MPDTQHQAGHGVQYLDPRELLVDANIRTDLQISQVAGVR